MSGTSVLQTSTNFQHHRAEEASYVCWPPPSAFRPHTLRWRLPSDGDWHCSVQFSRSVVSDSLRPHESQHARPPCPSPSTGVHSDSTSVELVMPSSHLILCRPLFLLPPIPPSIRVFSNEPTLRMRWPKYWSFSFSINPSKEHPGLISLRIDRLDLPEVQGTQESSTPQFKSVNSSALSFLHNPTLTFIHDHWRNHSLD